MTTLRDLLREMPDARLVTGSADAVVTGVSNDTRLLKPGDLFVAVPGLQRDGLELCGEAAQRGASAIVAERLPASDVSLPVVLVPSARSALADLAAAFYGHPSRQLAVVGVTGTDGKTSTVQLLGAILDTAGKSTGWLTTVNTKIAGTVRRNAAEHTTPEAPHVQHALAEMVQAGVNVAIVEASSHALALERLRATSFRVGVFTNLSREHLNFHGSFEAYRSAKAKLFELLPPDGLAVLNADDPASDVMRAASRAHDVTFGFSHGADVLGTDVTVSARGTSFRLVTREEEGLITTPLLGRFNVANWLGAYAAAHFFGARLEHLRQAATRQAPVPGRMQLIQSGQPFTVLVDFAHTPRALEQALLTARELSMGRVFVVFGLAGGRDAGNRAVMGSIAARLADFVVVTTDDPGEEDPASIAAQIENGIRDEIGAANQYAIELDRAAAIRRSLSRASPGDVVLLAGKGHEERMIVGNERLPWNDAAAAGQELQRLGYG